MGYEIAKLVAQSASVAYSPLKDMFLYLKNEVEYVEELEVNLTKLIVDMISVYSRKKQVDRLLEMSVSKEKSDKYRILCTQIEALRKDYDKFIKKYGKYCGDDLPSEMPAELDVSTAENIIAMLQEKRPTIKTRKFFKLAKLSENIKKLHGYVSEVANKMKRENLTREKEPELVQVKRGDINLPSANEYVSEILSYLRENGNRSIGIVGSIGMGKTNVMKRLNNQFEGNMSLKLDIVIWIDYPEVFGTREEIVKKMQDVIMERLKLTLEKTSSIDQNAEIISMALSWRKYIVLVDQVSSTIDLDKVGIRTNHEFGKVVVASSNKKVIKKMTVKQVEVKKLPPKDARILFQNVCGEVVDSQIRIIADKIIESCEGVSLVIKLVAEYLKDEKDENAWRDVKRTLQSTDKMVKWPKLREMGRAYKLVYDGLENNYWKKCLLFGALFPSNHKIYKDYLVECWMAEGFLPLFGTDVQQLRRQRDHGATVLGELMDRYLLEQCSDNRYVTMPKFFRKVALEQRYPEEEKCVIWVPQGNELLREEIWRTVTRMSLISCNLNLPECPQSHNISTLLLQCNPELVPLGDSFFSNMENLRILDMNQTNIESLPTSISRLKNLISLYLNGCIGLAELPPEINKLTKIEILDIRGTSIPNLPQEIGDMIQLRCLRLSFAPKGCNRNSKGKQVEVMISPNIINRLKQLEELIVETGCCNPSWNKIANRIALEVASLENLSTLGFHFPTVYSLKRFVTDSKSWRNTETRWEANTFKSFNISIGCCKTQHPHGSEITGILPERQLRFSTNDEISPVKEVLKQASTFELVGHLNVQSLSEFDLENAGALKVCVIEGCNNLLSIVDVDKKDDCIVDVDKTDDFGLLQCLEKLHLFNLQSLQSIWNGSVFSRSLFNLKVLTICGCHKLTWILDHKLAQALSSLKHLKVENCKGVVEIVNVQNHGEIADVPVDVDNSGILQKVETIEVVNLPNLESICRSASMKWNSLRTIVTISCKNLRNMRLTLSNAETLETIKCEESWYWSDRLQISKKEKQHFLPRCVFITVEEESCSNSRSVNAQVSDNNGSQVYNSEDGDGEATVGNTCDYFAPAKLKKRVETLHGSMSRVANKMKTENLIIEREPELVQLKHNDIDLPSVNECVSKILRYLHEDENKSIGVVGSTGVGKTNVMKRLNNHLEGNMSLKLDVVIWIDYLEQLGTKEKTIEKMQDVIMEMLKLKPEKANSIEQNAEIISMALSQKKYIVLIDQVSSTIDLDEVGIHKYHKFGKVVVASSDTKVIKQMTDQQVEVKKPSEDVEELQDIFEVPKKRIQENLLLGKNPELVQLKHDDIDLPSKLKPADFDHVPFSERLWGGETSLEKSKPEHTLDVQVEERYEYEIREESKAREDMTMMSSNLGESATTSTMGEMPKLMETELKIPGTRSWQEILNLNNYFGLDQNKDNYLFSVMKKLELDPKSTSEYHVVTEAPTADEWNRAFVLNFAEKDILLLPKEPQCPNLVLLFLQRNSQLAYIPPSFFNQMPALCFLDLSHTRIKSLPSSLFVHTKLQVLMLRGCVCLDSLPTDIKKLVSMEVLDLLGAQLYDVPNEIGQLTQLRQLQLSFYGPDNESEYAHLPSDLVSPSIISQLQSLQALSIVTHPEDHRWEKIAGDMTKDVGKLEELRYLQFYFPTVQVFEYFIGKSPSWEERRLEEFKFVVGNDVKRMVSRVPDEVESKYDEYGQCLRFVNGDEIPQVVTTVLTRTTAFCLDHHTEIQSLSEFGVFNFDKLKFCVVRECPKIQFMIKGNEGSETAAFFPNLEHLGFHYLWELEGICDHPMPSGSFKVLKYLTIHTCPKIEFIGSHSMLGCLSNLEEFLIEDCESVKSIVRENKKVKNDGTLLPRLQKLVLSYLPQLVTLGTGLCLPKDKITIQCCPKLILEPQVEKGKKRKLLGFIG